MSVNVEIDDGLPSGRGETPAEGAWLKGAEGRKATAIRERDRKRKAVLDRLPGNAKQIRDRLVHADPRWATGMEAVLGELAEAGLAYNRDGFWCAGPNPNPSPATRASNRAEATPVPDDGDTRSRILAVADAQFRSGMDLCGRAMLRMSIGDGLAIVNRLADEGELEREARGTRFRRLPATLPAGSGPPTRAATGQSATSVVVSAAAEVVVTHPGAPAGRVLDAAEEDDAVTSATGGEGVRAPPVQRVEPGAIIITDGTPTLRQRPASASVQVLDLAARGTAVRERRMALGYAQREIGEVLGFNQTTVSKIERGDLVMDGRLEAVEVLLARLEPKAPWPSGPVVQPATLAPAPPPLKVEVVRDVAADRARFGGWVRACREKLGLRQVELGMRLGLSEGNARTTIGTIERGIAGETHWPALRAFFAQQPSTPTSVAEPSKEGSSARSMDAAAQLEEPSADGRPSPDPSPRGSAPEAEPTAREPETPGSHPGPVGAVESCPSPAVLESPAPARVEAPGGERQRGGSPALELELELANRFETAVEAPAPVLVGPPDPANSLFDKVVELHGEVDELEVDLKERDREISWLKVERMEAHQKLDAVGESLDRMRIPKGHLLWRLGFMEGRMGPEPKEGT